jgi:hypothetical protein
MNQHRRQYAHNTQQHTVSHTHRDIAQAKAAAMNYVYLSQSLLAVAMTFFVLGLWFGANQPIF